MGFEALFEIGPVDGQTGPRTNPNRLTRMGLPGPSCCRIVTAMCSICRA